MNVKKQLTKKAGIVFNIVKNLFLFIFMIIAIPVSIPVWVFQLLIRSMGVVKTDEEAKEIVEKVVKFYSSELFSKLKIKPIEIQIINRHPSDLSNDPFLNSHRFNKNVSLTMGMRVDVTKFNTFSSDFQEQSLIRLYYGAMRQMSENSKFLITFKALLTLAHEIYHIYQKETNKEVLTTILAHPPITPIIKIRLLKWKQEDFS